MLSPLMAVLGARRPSANVWAWFVVLPMLVVLSWPAIIAWGTGQQSGFQLETPPLIAFLISHCHGDWQLLWNQVYSASVLCGIFAGLLRGSTFS